ncbi:MAG: trypsin-like peptidase domain-containing protein, partial [Raineya sp.]|nr:trypsin-like peptidase domain-containing protein [Raineya sp.]
TLHDKRSYEAKVIGTDPSTDLALLKIEEENLPALPFANSDKVRVGEWVLAVGNPFELNSTVTAGIISAKARNINLIQDKDNLQVESFLQTDASVNPGNSG